MAHDGNCTTVISAEKTEVEQLAELEAKIAAVLRGNVISDAVAKSAGWIDYGSFTVSDVEIPDAVLNIGAVMPVLPFNGIPKDIFNSTGMKFDNGKLDWALLPFESVEEIIKVLMVGAKKYKRDNWQLVEDGDTRYFNAAMRHITSWKQGEDLDPETGLQHLAHAGCCLLFLISKNRVGYDVKE